MHNYVENLHDAKGLQDKLAASASIETNDKQVFPEHLPLSEVQSGLKSGKYLQGTFMASRENFLEGFVSVQDQEDQVSHACILIVCVFLTPIMHKVNLACQKTSRTICVGKMNFVALVMRGCLCCRYSSKAMRT